MRLGAFLITLALAAAGAGLAGRSSDNFLLAMVVTGAWFALLAGVGFLLVRRRRRLLVPIGGALAVVGVVMTVVVGIPTLIGKTVDEDVVTGTPASAATPANANVERLAGRFVSIAHHGEGRAAVVELAGGARKLTLTGFATSPGPDLRVYLATGDPARAELGEFVDLGGLKGNRGDQQYDVPSAVDLDRYRVAVVWCRAFSVPFTAAALRAS